MLRFQLLGSNDTVTKEIRRVLRRPRLQTTPIQTDDAIAPADSTGDDTHDQQRDVFAVVHHLPTESQDFHISNKRGKNLMTVLGFSHLCLSPSVAHQFKLFKNLTSIILMCPLMHSRLMHSLIFNASLF